MPVTYRDVDFTRICGQRTVNVAAREGSYGTISDEWRHAEGVRGNHLLP